jgi:glutathione S-transferase
LQIGNHVYCDSSLIARVLEGLAPTPTLFPTPMAQALAEWIDSAMFETVVPMIMRPSRLDEALRLMLPEELQKLGPDRAAMRGTAARKPLGYKITKTHLDVYLARLDETLARQAFLLGSAPCIADFSAYHQVWILEKLAPEPLAPHAHLLGWMERISNIKGDEPTSLSSEDALRICRDAKGVWEPEEAFADPMGFTRDERVVARAADYGTDPVEGTLLSSTLNEVVLRREDARAGVVYVHFPRIGYEIAKAEDAT